MSVAIVADSAFIELCRKILDHEIEIVFPDPFSAWRLSVLPCMQILYSTNSRHFIE